MWSYHNRRCRCRNTMFWINCRRNRVINDGNGGSTSEDRRRPEEARQVPVVMGCIHRRNYCTVLDEIVRRIPVGMDIHRHPNYPLGLTDDRRREAAYCQDGSAVDGNIPWTFERCDCCSILRCHLCGIPTAEQREFSCYPESCERYGEGIKY